MNKLNMKGTTNWTWEGTLEAPKMWLNIAWGGWTSCQMLELSDACEGDGKPHPQTFKTGATILMNGILKLYYYQFVNPRFPEIWALGWKVNIYFENFDHPDFHLVQLWE